MFLVAIYNDFSLMDISRVQSAPATTAHQRNSGSQRFSSRFLRRSSPQSASNNLHRQSRSNLTEQESETQTLRELAHAREQDRREQIINERAAVDLQQMHSTKKSRVQRKIDQIEQYSYQPYRIIIMIEIIKWPISALELMIPFFGWMVMLAISLCVAIAGCFLLTIAYLTDPVKNHRGFLSRIALTTSSSVMSGIIPFVDVFIPFTLFAAIGVLHMARKEHRNAIARLQGKSTAGHTSGGVLRSIGRFARNKTRPRAS